MARETVAAVSDAWIEQQGLVQHGRLGRVYYARASGHLFRGRPVLDTPMAGAWFGDPAKAGAGVLFDLMGYTVDLLFWLLGFPAAAVASAVTYHELDRERAGAGLRRRRVRRGSRRSPGRRLRVA